VQVGAKVVNGVNTQSHKLQAPYSFSFRSKLMTQPFLGEIAIYAFNYPPRGWAFANGQLQAIQQNAALFSLLGTTYGGNGTTNFQLPNLQSRVPVHPGTNPTITIVQGQVGGTETHTLLPTEIAGHSHNFNAATSAAPGVAIAPEAGIPASAAHQPYRSGAAIAVDMTALSTQAGGGNQPHNNMQPFTVLSMCIALQGIFPSRN
jgi:microcystin-dependent protein